MKIYSKKLSLRLITDHLEVTTWNGMQMSVSDRLKLVRESLGKTQKGMAALMGLTYRTYQNYEDGVNNPGWDACEALSRMGFDANWFLTGEGVMRRPEKNGHVANGNNIVQGAHIDAEDVHLTVNQAGSVSEPGQIYGDPIDGLFLKDWKKLPVADRMKFWGLLKEKIEKVSGNKEG